MQRSARGAAKTKAPKLRVTMAHCGAVPEFCQLQCSGQFLRAELPAKARKLLVDMAQSAAVHDCRQLQRDDQFCEGELQ